jgi:hypothetical protein
VDEKSSNSAALPTGKILPQAFRNEAATVGTVQLRRRLFRPKHNGGNAMYIGLGGLLILILILWLLGVI